MHRCRKICNFEVFKKQSATYVLMCKGTTNNRNEQVQTDFFDLFDVKKKVEVSFTVHSGHSNVTLCCFEAPSGAVRGAFILVNVDIFSEGFDCPEVEFIQLLFFIWLTRSKTV